MAIELLNLHAAEKVSAPEGWRPYLWESLPKDFRQDRQGMKIVGAQFNPYVRGPKKGQPNPRNMRRGTQLTAIIGIEEHKVWVKSWEGRTGKCGECAGEGKLYVGWNNEEGAVYRECQACNGSGKKP